MGVLMRIGERIRILRGDLLQGEFAEKLGFHKNTIGRWERGDSVPDVDNLAKILDTYPEINPAWLVTGDGEKLLIHTEKGKKSFQPSELGQNIIQALLENIADLNKTEARNWAGLTIVVWELIDELRETLPSVDEIKSILKAYYSLSKDFPELQIPGGIDKFLNITYKMIAGNEEINTSDVDNNDESIKES
jgi:transcriptional regulator with XRE-family HTH domain